VVFAAGSLSESQLVEIKRPTTNETFAVLIRVEMLLVTYPLCRWPLSRLTNLHENLPKTKLAAAFGSLRHAYSMGAIEYGKLEWPSNFTARALAKCSR
jgi:hypothetical protein